MSNLNGSEETTNVRLCRCCEEPLGSLEDGPLGPLCYDCGTNYSENDMSDAILKGKLARADALTIDSPDYGNCNNCCFSKQCDCYVPGSSCVLA